MKNIELVILMYSLDLGGLSILSKYKTDQYYYWSESRKEGM